MRIAILDDEKTHLQLMEQAIIGGNVMRMWDEPVTCELYTRGLELLDVLKKGAQFDCLLLDRQLPDMSGDVILAWLRQHATVYMPVILVTSLRLEESIVEGLEMGADDYVSKPFRSPELLARVRCAVKNNRRVSSNTLVQAQAVNAAMQVIDVGGYEFEPLTLSVKYNGVHVILTDREFCLAQMLFANLNGVLSRSDLFQAAWKRIDKGGSRALDTHIYKVRNKLNLIPERGFVLRAVYGYGYRLEYFEPSRLLG